MSPPGPLRQPVGSGAAAGAGCLAPFDGTFYRGVVTERAGDAASVHFIDYGNTETVPAAEVRRLQRVGGCQQLGLLIDTGSGG